MFSATARYQFFPLAIAVDWRVQKPSLLPCDWQWQYQFTDGSVLQGQLKTSTLACQAITPETPTKILRPCGDIVYQAAFGKTALLHWHPSEITCLELEEELLLMASSDNYVSNSLCLINCPQRQWAQVTHWGTKLVAEPFDVKHWSLQPFERYLTC